MCRILNISSEDPNDPYTILREKWKNLRFNIPFCCESLRQQITKGCSHHGYECPDYLVQIGISGHSHNPNSIWCGQAGNASYKISYCPFCGSPLPDLETILNPHPQKVEKIESPGVFVREIDNTQSSKVFKDTISEDAFVNDQVATELRIIISEILGIDEERILPSSTDWDMDSLDEVEIILEVENKFNIEILDSDAESMKGKTFHQMCVALRQHIAKTSEESAILRPSVDSPKEDEDEFEEFYLRGLQAGLIDKPVGTPRYMPDDDLGCDSKADKKYIEGYIYGYYGLTPTN